MFTFFTLFAALYLGGCVLSILTQINDSGSAELGTTIIEAWVTAIGVGTTLGILYIIVGSALTLLT